MEGCTKRDREFTVTVTRLVNILKILSDKFSLKSCPNVWELVGYFEKHHLEVK